MAPIIKTEKITHVYSTGTVFEQAALTGVDFQAERGEYVGIIGHTGSGKSTFIQTLNGLIKPTSGTVFFDGTDIRQSKARTREVRFKVGLVFQYPEYQLFEETVFKDIAFGPKNMGLPENEVSERVREAASFVGLGAGELEKSPFELSGGQRRRAAIAGVIAMRPQVLIADEPTAGLDPSGSAEIIANIGAYRRSAGATVVIVTHNMDEIARNADRVAVFDRGRIIIDASPAQTFARGEELTAMGLGLPSAAMIAARLRERGLRLPDGIITAEGLRAALREFKKGAGGGNA
ncbi:MAG: energy-coupling factor transporter ATPase [Oscillospiraceae bacterium]|nr:energy-coupling factor transporter ATPase [Oscillospiraceae bacterium]